MYKPTQEQAHIQSGLLDGSVLAMCVGADGEVRVLTWVQWQSVMEIISIKKKITKKHVPGPRFKPQDYKRRYKQCSP